MGKRLVAGLLGVLATGTLPACSDDSTEDPKAASAQGAGGHGGGPGAGGAVAGGMGGSGGAVCDDSGPDPTNHTAGTCSNLGETSLVAYCNEAIAKLKPGVAYAAISCLAVACLRGPPCTIDEYRQQAAQCLIDALAAACADEAADATCAELETTCGTAPAECHALIDGMTEPTRAEVVACARNGCGEGLEGCVGEVLTP